ncbi:MAG: type II toxin-antitoxin system HicB family antitoxin [Thaumarchaeota archaeon]|jgi:predicted RNase H-like HicB family nuclease|nr:type II toxin-antitoxin system HicB family antitoxin [Nitrososphaerota archaeon]
MKTFTVALEKDEETGLYVAQCLEIPQAISQGATEEEAIRNVKEAIELALEHLEERVAKGKKTVEVAIE